MFESFTVAKTENLSARRSRALCFDGIPEEIYSRPFRMISQKRLVLAPLVCPLIFAAPTFFSELLNMSHIYSSVGPFDASSSYIFDNTLVPPRSIYSILSIEILATSLALSGFGFCRGGICLVLPASVLRWRRRQFLVIGQKFVRLSLSLKNSCFSS